MRRIALLSAVALLAACGGSSGGSTGTGYLRVGNLSVDVAAVDFCVRATGTTTWSAPVMAAQARNVGGLQVVDALMEGTFSVSKYFPYSAGNYDVAVFSNAGGSCASPLLTATNVSLTDGSHKFIALVGITGGTNGADHALATFTDETTVATGNVLIRFANTGIYVASQTSAPVPLFPMNVGAIPAVTGGTYSLLFGQVTYPGIALSGGIDANGYLSVPAAGFAAGADLVVCPYPLDPTSGLCKTTTVPANTINAGTVASAYVVGIAGVDPNALLCGDNQTPPFPDWPYSMCTTNPAGT